MSPYVTLGNRPLDQWKVTELREELKRRRLTIKGLKEDLVKRLDEAVRSEWEDANENTDDSPKNDNQSELPSELEMTDSIVSGIAKNLTDPGIDTTEKTNSNPENEIDDHKGSLNEGKANEADLDHKTSPVETTLVVNEAVESVTALDDSLLNNEGTNEDGDSTAGLNDDKLKSPQEDINLEIPDPQLLLTKEGDLSLLSPNGPSAQDPTFQLESDDSKCPQPDPIVQPLKYQVSEVETDLGLQVISDSVSTDSVSIIEKNELKVEVITDNKQLELDVNHEMLHPPPSSVVAPDGGESHPMDVEEPLDKKGSTKETAENVESGDLGPPEKLSLDRSSGDDSMEEDVMESKQTEYKSDSNEIKDEKSEMVIIEDEINVDIDSDDKPDETGITSTENEAIDGLTSVKRKFYNDKKEAIGPTDTAKRLRRWNVEGLKVSEPQNGNSESLTTPKDAVSQDTQPIFKRFSRSDSAVNDGAPKERIVPPSPKPPTDSLRIDQFLRPFTLKAVQELLGKTGTVTSFWMDQIKTHCYVSYSSIEEAIETRNAVYNLQWPTNGGRLLVAEFVDPQEVKTRVDAPPTASPATPSTHPPTPTVPPQPSPRKIQRQQLPPTPVAIPPSVRDRINLPPPPPLTEKIEAPIVTLDDLFRKTKATPRIYYLPLSDEQVAEKMKANGKNV